MKIAIVGASGKLGSEVTKILSQTNQVFEVDIKNGEFSSLDALSALPDVVVDVTNANQSLKSALYACENQIPLVVACTGHCNKQLEFLKSLGQSIPVFISANMAFGMQVFKEASLSIAKTFPCDVHIHEQHHKSKLDAPSGTARELARSLNTLDIQPSISSARGGDIIGEHEVDFYGDGETIKLSHTATSRAVFAHGIAKAVEFISRADVGVYCMQDLVQSYFEAPVR